MGLFGINTSILRLEHFGNSPAVHSIEARTVNTVFPTWERPLELEVSLPHSRPLPQVSQGSLAQAFHASVENCHDGAAVP